MILRLNLMILSLAVTTTLTAQKTLEKHIGIGIMPGIQGRILTLKNFTPPAGYTASEWKDSLNKADHMKASVGLHAWYSVSLNKKWSVQAGLQYMDMGFKRVKQDLKFLDVIHPEIGRVNDVAQTTQKDVIFNTRYQYLNVQGLAQRHLKLKHKNKDMDGMSFSIVMGGSASILLRHEIHAKLKGFTAYGKSDFHISNTGYQASPANINMVFGGRMDYALYPKTRIYVQPYIILPLLTANYASERHHLFGGILEIGLSYSLAKKKTT